MARGQKSIQPIETFEEQDPTARRFAQTEKLLVDAMDDLRDRNLNSGNPSKKPGITEILTDLNSWC